MLVLESPVKLRLVGYEDRIPELERALTFKLSSAEYEYSKFKKNTWFIRKYGEEAYYERLGELKEKTKRCLLYEDEVGYYTLPGLKSYLENRFLDREFRNDVEYPEPGALPYAKVPTKVPRPYQNEIVKRLLEVKHGAVEVGTGLGKSLCILMLIKQLGLQTVVMVPSASIGNQIYQDLLEAFGKRYVGMLGDGKREVKKLITVALAQSLTRIDPGSEAWERLSTAAVFIGDESHLVPAETFAKVCHGLCRDAPYRFFFSGTQMRNDGADLLLSGITGPIVYTMTVREGVDQGYLARPRFKMVRVGAVDSYQSDDANEMTRHHLLYNPNVNKIAAMLANNAVSALGHQVLILVDEVEQLAHLYPYLKHEVRFAHGGVTGENRDKVLEQFHKSDPKKLVKQFNNGEFPILVGTSCISTGTDIQTVETIINIQGGRSPIKFAQSVGRGTRKTPLKPSKEECLFFDFDVRTSPDERFDTIHRHALARAAIYEDIYGPVDWME